MPQCGPSSTRLERRTCQPVTASTAPNQMFGYGCLSSVGLRFLGPISCLMLHRSFGTSCRQDFITTHFPCNSIGRTGIPAVDLVRDYIDGDRRRVTWSAPAASRVVKDRSCHSGDPTRNKLNRIEHGRRAAVSPACPIDALAQGWAPSL